VILEFFFNIHNKPQNLHKLVDYGLLSFISVIIFWLMNAVYGIINNWGVAIILVTTFIKLLFFPLSAKSYKSMAKMRKLHPQIKTLQKLYKSDRHQLSRKMIDLYKSEKVSPIGSFLPMLIQIPVFIALYWVLLESVQLRHSPFIFWLKDLSDKDPYFVLPLLMGFSMFIQQKINPTSTAAFPSKFMLLMPVVFTLFFLSFPSGLVLYWLTNNIITIFQQVCIAKNYR
jgi:YidC/Oxa1 family membrane protein insertase